MMFLPREEAELVTVLHSALMEYVNEQLNVGSKPRAPYAALTAEQQRKVVNELVGRLELIDAFITANPARLSEEELDIVSGWRHLVSGRFIALRQLKKHMILLPVDGKATAYGVLGCGEPMESAIGRPLPAMIETVLLPFRGRIISDGIVSTFDVDFGPGSRRLFEGDLRQAKASNRLLTALPDSGGRGARGERSPEPKPVRKPRPGAPLTREILTQLIGMTDAFCQARLDEEYAVLCRKLAEKLAAKRPSPLLRGNLESWASGIVRTIGWVNFLSDRSQSPHLNLTEIDEAFGVAQSTGQGKAKTIRQMLKISQFDHQWIRPSQWATNPILWMLHDSNGLMFDIRKQSLEMQRAAFRQGLIPYVPADREAAAVREQIAKSPSRRLFQFKIELRHSQPLVWRRIQVWDDTLDKFHEHLQTAMGWTNSHLHQFVIRGRRCGDPELLDDGFEPLNALDSTRTSLSAVLPSDGSRLSFEYIYDFGDHWVHDVVFEGVLQPEPGIDYPLCLEGARACPPEDVGGIPGFEEYLEAMADPNHKRHRELVEWNGRYNPDAFDPRQVSHRMQEGLPEWRKTV